ncbi:PREDICTED: uncharacterized protein LOC104744175 [Camelina sativa]|uniref:Uncharacterized protein LOC104744175 n=1 Tax=Camelina sativa TaxID=90675 RepID=A0ABM0VZ84_CAMSA|nr:PREDICTED: uncharacterized protein LOC104744175 [Camelina sativa]
MVGATRSGLVRRGRNQEMSRSVGNANRPQLVDDSSDVEEVQPRIVPYGSDSDDDSSQSVSVKNQVDQGVDDLERENPIDDEVEFVGKRKKKDPVSVSDTEVGVEEISVQEQIERHAEKQRSKKQREVASASKKKSACKSKRPRSVEPSARNVRAKSGSQSDVFVSKAAKLRYSQFFSRNFTAERQLDMSKKDEFGFIEKILSLGLGPTIHDPSVYVKEIIYEFYANLPNRKARDGVQVFVREHWYEFSPKAINQDFNMAPLTRAEMKADAAVDKLSQDELAEFLSGEDKSTWATLKVADLPEESAALLMLAAYNWVPSKHRNHLSVKRARVVYKIIKGIWFDFGQLIYNQIMNISWKDPTRYVVFPRTIFETLRVQEGPLEWSDEEEDVYAEFYTKDARTGHIYDVKHKLIPETKESTPVTPAGRQPAEGFSSTSEVIQLGSIRVPHIGQEDVDISYEALVDTAQALPKTYGSSTEAHTESSTFQDDLRCF